MRKQKTSLAARTAKARDEHRELNEERRPVTLGPAWRETLARHTLESVADPHGIRRQLQARPPMPTSATGWITSGTRRTRTRR